MGTAAERPATLQVWIAHATDENREKPYFDSGLEAIREVVRDLPFDTWHKVLNQRETLMPGKEINTRMDGRYTLFLTPEAEEKDGSVRMELRVELDPKRQGDKPVGILVTRLVMQPGKKIKLHGFKKEKGELVIVMALEPRG